jgi:hypothetical protein
MVQKELAGSARFLAAGAVWDVSAFAQKGVKSISIPRLDSFTAVDRASGAAGDATVLTSAVDKLDLDQAAYVAYIVDTQDEIESTLNLELELARRAASAEARFVDSKIITNLESVGQATTTAGDVSKAIILEMYQKLLEAYATESQLYLAVSPKQHSKMLDIADFVRADSYGAQPTALNSCVIGQVYGVKVFVSNLLGADQYFMADKDGMAIGFHYALQMSEQGANEYGVHSKRVAWEQKFGTKGLAIAVNVSPAGKSALFIKDNN